MNYSEGRVGRVIVAKFDDGEDFVGGMKSLVEQSNVESAVFFFLGAFREGDVVAGPKAPVIPPTPDFIHFDGAWEVVGIGTMFTRDGVPFLHMHGAIGSGGNTLVGCLRKLTTTFLIVEVVMLEICGSTAVRTYNAESGHTLLDPDPQSGK